jgi:signal peptidase II
LKKVFSKFQYIIIGLCIIFLDLKVKNYALATLSSNYSTRFPYGGKAVFSGLFDGINFSLNLVKNHGAAWGLFSDYPHALAYLRVGIVFYLLTRIFRPMNSQGRKLGLTLISFGALGNLIDYFMYGYVVDMFHFTFWNYHFPVFNIADASIFLGAVILIFSRSKLRL